MQNFIKNVSECTKIGGYFIGTCYDGKRIFNDLSKQNNITISKRGVKIWEITKDYSNNSFPSDETSIGYAINVYQETINKVIKEYLVNFDYLIRIMENAGFRIITKEEANKFNLPNGVGSFEELYYNAIEKVKNNPSSKRFIKDALRMSIEEKQITFYNNYFVFVKIADPEPVVEIDGETSIAVENPAIKKENINKESIPPEKTSKPKKKQPTIKITKKKTKLKLVEKSNE